MAIGRLLSLRLTNGSSVDMTVDGSSTAVDFTLTAPDNIRYIVRSLTLTIHSTGMDFSTAAELRNFGAVGAALSNGVRIYETKGRTAASAVDVDLMPTAWTRMVDLFRYAEWSGSDLAIKAHTDAVDVHTDFMAVTFAWPEKHPLILRPETADALTVKVQDALGALTLFEAHARGTQIRG